MDKEFYIKKIEESLNGVNTYIVVNRNSIKSIERNLNNFLKNWLQKGYISKQQYYKLRSSDSFLSKAYGLPKIHKENIPLRIIVSSTQLFILLHHIYTKLSLTALNQQLHRE